MSEPESEPQPPRPDLTACDREPIHVPGSIQSHGVLLVSDAVGLRVLHASDNCPVHVGADAAGLVGRPLDAALGPDAAAMVRSRLNTVPADDSPHCLISVAPPAAGGTRFHVLAHRRRHRLLLELEPADGDDEAEAERGRRIQAQVLGSALRLQSEATVRGLLDAAAREVRRLTGFDRVMAYRFDADGHGEVVAEDRAGDWHSYLGHHFPASDIPQQARDLYVRNRVRLIPDVDYRPARLLPPNDPDTGGPVDLTYAALRSVSPVHVEYLRNMGVAASMSVSVVTGGRLWGLIACHHRTPRFVPYDVRGGCEHLGEIVAAQLATNERAEEREQRLSLTATQARLLERMAGHADYADGLTEAPDDLLDLTAATGAAVAAGDRLHLLGLTPPGDEVRRLLGWLASRGGDGQYLTDRLVQAYPPGEAWSGVASGVLAVALGPVRRDWVVWFRPEAEYTVVWAGDPDKPVGPTDRPTDRPTRIHPRKSFEAWTQVVRGRSLPWERRHADAAAAFRAAVTGIVLRKADELAAERRRRAEAEEARAQAEAARAQAEAANRAKDRHLAFLAHELRGPLTPALMAAAAMAADDGLPAGVRADAALVRRNIELTTRLADDLLDFNRVALGKLDLRAEPVDVHDTLRAGAGMCAADAVAKGVRLELQLRAERHVADADAAKLTQVWVNVLKNATKFTPAGGSITVRTSDVAGGRLRTEVRDTGVGVDADLLPRMFNLFEQGDRSVSGGHGGLGLGLAICKGIVEAHGGTITAASDGKGRGTTIIVELPAAVSVAQPPARRFQPTPAGSDRGRRCGLKMKILLVDDHEDTLRVMSRLLAGLGHDVETATGVGPALAAADAGEFDLLISDVGLGEESGLDLMRELLKRRPIRGIALTGYGTDEDVRRTREAGFSAHVTKPVNFDQLQALILELSSPS